MNAAEISAQDRARKIKIIIFDVDGVLTDGSIWLVPVPVTIDGKQETKMVEVKGYSAHDGAGFSLAKLAGIKCGIITKRISETVALRARDLRIEYVYQGQAFKMKAVREIMAQSGTSLEQIAYVGDDTIDLPVMRNCGLAIAVANARRDRKRRGPLCNPESRRSGRGARCH